MHFRVDLPTKCTKVVLYKRGNCIKDANKIDDGISGTTFERDSFKRMISDIEDGKIGIVLCKDMSRAGRDFLRVELLMEKFREKGVRFLAINDNVDSNNGMDDFAPFRNIINEW